MIYLVFSYVIILTHWIPITYHVMVSCFMFFFLAVNFFFFALICFLFLRSRESQEASNPGNNLYVTGLSTRVSTGDLEKFFGNEGKVRNDCL